MEVRTDEQKRYWSDVDIDHFAWQTRGGYIAAREAELLASVTLARGETLLEIGCGEGANLHHLIGRLGSGGGRFVGVDFTLGKARFAAAETGALTACADAQHLPFRDHAFDAVLIRDLLHHVPDRLMVLEEARRVLRDGGRITVIEPNGKNPLIAAMATAISAERGMRASTEERLRGELLRAGFADLSIEPAQALPVSRALYHYRHGSPRLARIAPVARAVAGLERAFELLPRSRWSYVVANAVAPRSQPRRRS